MRSTLFVSVVALLVSGCALRPRYADFVSAARSDAKEVTFLLIDADTTMPVANAKVELSELKNRVIVNTAADGTFKVPLDKKYIDENPVFVVTLPRGVTQYKLMLAPYAAPPPTVVVPAPVSPVMPEAVDAGTPASNG